MVCPPEDHQAVPRVTLMAQQPLESRNVAARIAGLATNVLATGLILILGAVGGQHALRWWSAVRSTPPDPVAEVLGPEAVQRRNGESSAAGGSISHLLSFGDDPLLATRTELQGDTQQVLRRLRDQCRSIAERVERVERTPGPAEQQMLARIGRHEPVASTSRWRMYQIETPVPLVVTVLDQPGRAPPDSAANIAAVESRVVSWGLAFPAVSEQDTPSDRWTLFTLTAETPQVGPVAPSRTLPVPPQCRRTLSLRAESGAVMVGFSTLR